jgi:hypothetical protein
LEQTKPLAVQSPYQTPQWPNRLTAETPEASRRTATAARPKTLARRGAVGVVRRSCAEGVASSGPAIVARRCLVRSSPEIVA